MKWKKKGVLFCPNNESDWANNSALQPTPILLDERTLRIYLGFRSTQGVSRVGFVDVNPDNPSEVLNVCDSPALDIGTAGCFDESGVVPCAVFEEDGKVYLYYAGYQLGQKIRFTVFGGLAVSHDGGTVFERVKQTPVVDRTNKELFFRVIHTIIKEDGKYKVWYGGGSRFLQGKDKTLPCYDIRYMESDSPFRFPEDFTVALGTAPDEYRVGRPYVFKENGLYKMFFGASSEDVPYELSYAESKDGMSWIRKNDDVGIEASDQDWDSQMTAYPAVIHYKDKAYMFYNGNDYGRTGVGYAERSRTASD